MSETHSSGCGFLLAIIIGMLTVFGITLPQVEDAVRSIVPRQETDVSIAPPEAQMPFTLQNDQIIYSWRYSFHEPYSLYIQGWIHDANGMPVTNILVNIGAVSVEGVAPETPIHFHAKNFPYTYDDPSSWIKWFPNGAAYNVWLSDTNGNMLSPIILVYPQDDTHNVANLTFVQTGAMP